MYRNTFRAAFVLLFSLLLLSCTQKDDYGYTVRNGRIVYNTPARPADQHVVLFSIILFGERLNALQWSGVATAFIALMLLSRSSKQEGITFKSNSGMLAMCISIISGVISALYDKHIITGFEPLFVQSWGNFYITILLGICLGVRRWVQKEKAGIKWDWTLVLIALLITGADAMYFFALKQDGAMLSVVSLLRRCSVLVTFVAGAFFFKEKHVARKAVNIAVLMFGMVLLLLGSK